jgi:hypothetical protein
MTSGVAGATGVAWAIHLLYLLHQALHRLHSSVSIPVPKERKRNVLFIEVNALRVKHVSKVKFY